MIFLSNFHHAKPLPGRGFNIDLFKKGESVMEFLQKYPMFYYSRLRISDGRIIILDEALAMPVQKELESLETIDGNELLFLNDSQLAVETEEILHALVRCYDSTLLVFPGNGSNYPRKRSRICQESYGASVYAQRVWQLGSDPFVTAGSIMSDTFLFTNIEAVVVVDDVISSGKTLEMVYARNAWRFTKAKWIGVSWVAQFPQAKAKSGVNGYEQIATACAVGKTNGGRVPVNSISTLRQDQEIAQSYARRHFRYPDEFLVLINQ